MVHSILFTQSLCAQEQSWSEAPKKSPCRRDKMLRSMTHESCILGNHQNFRRTIQKRWLKFEARRGPKKVTLRLSLGEIIRMTWHDSGEGNSTAGDKQAWWLEREWNDRTKTARVQRPHGPTRTTRTFFSEETRKYTEKCHKSEIKNKKEEGY